MNVDSYFQRISYCGSRLPTLDTLKSLSKAHILTVPFENFDVITKESIKIDEELLYDKIVNRRRGGFCYELNGLFRWLLKSLGYDVIYLAGRVLNRRTKVLGPEFDHMILSVAIPDRQDERYLVDVGLPICGGCPLLIVDGAVDRQGDLDIRLRVGSLDTWFLEMKGIGLSSEWTLRYQFTLHPWQISDYTSMCLYHQTNPKAPFTQTRFAMIALKDGGRVVFTDEGEKGPRLVETNWNPTENQIVKTETLLEGHQVTKMLKCQFGLDV
ncbi:arylamine N-acetyltransferase, pineal gland isozyme NAT-10-like [Corticium candelabrum]|uniref:arylamine N-acetyltransferase, pineal gland isozyme NAT-10-like n=1 Tax=Corticium candelabrum TaxID=121492 RepID=UPI002E26410C|nr:arylamine N-acetyltransferase, pineal gland isozyme NAT-10-like [Corticium candelabrum]